MNKKKNEIYLLQSPKRKRLQECTTPHSEVGTNTLKIEYHIEIEENMNEQYDEDCDDLPEDSDRHIEEKLPEVLEETDSETNLNNNEAEESIIEEHAVFLQHISTLMKALPADLKVKFKSIMYTTISKLCAEEEMNKLQSS